jgi:uncharacterized RDD family membrane protein YckC
VNVQTDRIARAAGFWRRFFGAVIDGILLSVVGGILRAIGTPALGYDDGATVWVAGGNGLSLLLSLAYFTFFHGRTGQTPGDAALGIRVLDIDTGEVIGYGRAALRWAVSIVSGIALLLGYFWMLWDPRKQTWHDKAARSLPIMQ